MLEICQTHSGKICWTFSYFCWYFWYFCYTLIFDIGTRFLDIPIYWLSLWSRGLVILSTYIFSIFHEGMSAPFCIFLLIPDVFDRQKWRISCFTYISSASVSACRYTPKILRPRAAKNIVEHCWSSPQIRYFYTAVRCTSVIPVITLSFHSYCISLRHRIWVL